MLFTSQIVAGASGSVGGLTASRNRFGQYFRVRAVPVNPNTISQQSVRGFLASASTKWQTLSAAQRDAWDMYGANVTTLNKLGQTVNLTGFNWFCKCNSARLQVGLSFVLAGPTTFAIPTFTPISYTVEVTGTAGAISLVFDDNDDWANEVGGALAFAISRPLSQTIGFFKGPFRFSGSVLGAGTAPTSPAVLGSPFAMAIGQKTYGRARVMLADGRLSSVQIANDIAT